MSSVDKPKFWQRMAVSIQPRSVHEARWAAVIAFATIAASCFLMTMVDVAYGGSWQMNAPFHAPEPSYINGVFLPIGLTISAVTLRFAPISVMRYVPLPLAIAGTLMTSYINYLAASSDLTSQAFFMLSVLYASYTLRQTAASIAVAFACVNEAFVGAMWSNSGEWMPGSLAFVILNFGLWFGFSRAQDIRHEKQAELERLATRDPLTGLANRPQLQDVLRKLEEQPVGGEEPHGSLLLVDLDHFKTLNDDYGHPFGDEVLANIATHLSSTEHPGATAARIGGDELAVFLPNATPGQAQEIGQQILEKVRATTLEANGETVSYTVSIGAAHWPSCSGSHASLYSAADVALYSAKRAGRDQFCLLTADMKPTSDNVTPQRAGVSDASAVPPVSASTSPKPTPELPPT